MPLIRGANITSQQFDKMNYTRCLTSIFKMGLKWEAPSFCDFPSHKLYKYAHRRVLHVSQLKMAWSTATLLCAQSSVSRRPGFLLLS